MSTSTAVVCAECGKGNFRATLSAFDPADFYCTVCGTEVTWLDFEGNDSEGESLVVVDGVLTVVSAS